MPAKVSAKPTSTVADSTTKGDKKKMDETGWKKPSYTMTGVKAKVWQTLDEKIAIPRPPEKPQVGKLDTTKLQNNKWRISAMAERSSEDGFRTKRKQEAKLTEGSKTAAKYKTSSN